MVVFASTESAAASACGEAFDRIAELEAVLSDYNPASEASRVMRQAPGVWHPVSSDLATALMRCRRVFLASSGRFDTTVGPATRLWRSSRQTKALPSERDRLAALRLIGFDRMDIETDPDQIRFDTPGLMLDFGGIGKGMACDEAATVLRRAGIASFLIDFGGDILAGDPPPSGASGWAITVLDGLGAERAVQLSGRAVATSGDTTQFIELGGRRYSHIVDPATALGLEHRVAATVIADHGWVADALASAACVGGESIRGELEAAFPDAQIGIVTIAD